MKRSIRAFISSNQRDRAARAATEELAPEFDGKRVVISVDRTGKVTHRPARTVESNVSTMLTRPLKRVKISGIKNKPVKSPRQKALAEAVRVIAGTD